MASKRKSMCLAGLPKSMTQVAQSMFTLGSTMRDSPTQSMSMNWQKTKEERRFSLVAVHCLIIMESGRLERDLLRNQLVHSALRFFRITNNS